MRQKTTNAAYVAATLQNVLYVPDLAKQPGGPIRLFSASSAADQSGAEVTTGASTRITLRNGLVIPGFPEVQTNKTEGGGWTVLQAAIDVGNLALDQRACFTE